MIKYLRSEQLKHKRSMLNKLLWIAPIITAFFAWIMGGFTGFQYMSFYWWFAFLLPGTIAIFCALVHQKEKKAGKYASVFSLPIKLAKFEAARSIVLIGKLLVAALFLAFFVSLSHLISPATAVYTVKQSILGSLGIMLSSIWQIPFCLYLTRMLGMPLTIMLHSLLGIFTPIALGKVTWGWFCPYCWTAKLAEPLMGIEANGVFTSHYSNSAVIWLALALSIGLFTLLLFFDAKRFANQEVK